jgi:glyoxylase-like metal-dependent hydrolase (beta-lactamase superfamily II)
MIERLRVGPIGTNCYLIPTGQALEEGFTSCVIVDPGSEPERIVGLVEARKLAATLIVCTHGHLDHCASLGAICDFYLSRGRKVPVAIHGLDAHYLGAAGEATNRALFAAIGALPFFNSLWAPLPEADLILEDGEFLPSSSWRVIHTPGHSAGSICLYDADAGILISGDTLFRDGVGRTDGPDSNDRDLHESIAWKLFSLPPETLVFPGHGEPTRIVDEARAID